MSRNNKAALWMKRLVVGICIAVVMLSAAIVAVRLGVTGALEAALLAFFLCLSVLFLIRQFRLRREIEAAKALATEAALGSAPVSTPSKAGGFERLAADRSSPTPTLSADDFPDAVSAEAPRKEVASALGKDDLLLYLQPIVSLPQKEPVFYQTLLRLKMADGRMLDPPQYQKIAEEAGAMPGIDRRNVTQSIRMLKTLTAMHKHANVFCTLSAGSLKNGKNYDRVFSLLERNTAVRDHLVVEVSQANYAGAGSAGRKRLEAIARLGFNLCMGGLTNLNIDLDALSKSGFSYLKVPAILLTTRHEDDAEIYPETLSAHAALHDIRLIATEVIFDHQVPDIMDRDVMAAQGGLFAEPKQVRSELLDED